MRHRWHSVLWLFLASSFPNFATPPAPLWDDIRVKHTWNIVPENWESLGPPPNGTTIDLYISLKPRLENALIDALYEVSDPKHEKYGAHLSKEQVAELVEPHQDTLELVHSWLEYHGVPSSSTSRSHGGGWLTVTGMPVSQANELLCASYQIYKHTGTNENEMVLRTVGYSLPAKLHTHVQTVAPTTLFASPRAPPRKRPSDEAVFMANATSGEGVSRRDDDDDEAQTTPDFLRWLYRTRAYVPAARGRNALGILGLLNDYPTEDDLLRFMVEYRLDAADATFTIVPVNGGGNEEGPPGVEASVDIQYGSVMSYPTPQFFYSVGGILRWSTFDGRPFPGDAYLEWLKYLLDQPNIPPTIAISYDNFESLFPLAYATVLCNLFAQLGLRGVSVLVASGDQAVGEGDCLDSYGNVRFMTMFPATCPWVTTVGGTMGFPEEAWPHSSGGFSQYFPRPNYQDGAVLRFLRNLGNQYAGLYNAGGRGVPDVAGQAHALSIFVNGWPHDGSGTSASTPIVAGVVALLNDYLISTGRTPLGFLNLRLYGQARAGLNDITAGSNPSCNTEGFTAIVGWDAVSGLGTPDFQRLQLIFNNLIKT